MHIHHVTGTMDNSRCAHLRALPAHLLTKIFEDFLSSTYGARACEIKDNTLSITISLEDPLYQHPHSRPGYFRTHLRAFQAVWPAPLEIEFTLTAYTVRGNNVGYPAQIKWIRKLTTGLPPEVTIRIPAWAEWELPHCMLEEGWFEYVDDVADFGYVMTMFEVNGYYTMHAFVAADLDPGVILW